MIIYESFEQALAEIVAKRISDMPSVQSFREDVLGNSLIKPEDVEDWLREQLDPQELLREPKEPEHRPTDVYGFNPLFVRMPAEGVLRRLYGLAIDLERICPVFQRQGIVDLILTGIPPQLHRFIASEQSAALYNMPSTSSRIKMSVDPRISVNELGEHYAEVRKRIWKIDRSSSRRTREPGPKSLTLGVFLEKQGVSNTWEELRERWNKAYPAWKYKKERLRNFARDAKAAWERLTGDEYKAEVPEMNKTGLIRWSAIGRKPKGHVTDLKGGDWQVWGYIESDGSLRGKKGEHPPEYSEEIADYLLDTGEVDIVLENTALRETKEYLKFEATALVDGEEYVLRADIKPPTTSKPYGRVAAWDITPVRETLVPYPATVIEEVEDLLPGAILKLRDIPISWN